MGMIRATRRASIAADVTQKPAQRAWRGLVPSVLSAFLLLGCGKQAAGERCDELNGDGDCESGLVCTPLSTLRAEAEVGAVCCPPRGSSGRQSLGACRAQDLPQLDAGPGELRDLDRYRSGDSATAPASSDGSAQRDSSAQLPARDASLTDASLVDASSQPPAGDASSLDASLSDAGASAPGQGGDARN